MVILNYFSAEKHDIYLYCHRLLFIYCHHCNLKHDDYLYEPQYCYHCKSMH